MGRLIMRTSSDKLTRDLVSAWLNRENVSILGIEYKVIQCSGLKKDNSCTFELMEM